MKTAKILDGILKPVAGKVAAPGPEIEEAQLDD